MEEDCKGYLFSKTKYSDTVLEEVLSKLMRADPDSKFSN